MGKSNAPSEGSRVTMGCGGSVQVDETTKQLDADLKAEQKKLAKELKPLLLGAGESGKSTIAKQMKILHLNGFTKAELMGFKPVLHSNAIEIVQTLLHGCTELGIDIQPEHEPLFKKLEELSSIETPVDQQLAGELRQAYNWPEVRESYEKRADLQLPSSAEYTMSNSERKKWAQCFEDVTAIIFVVAMDGYDMKLYEDENVNRVQEARKLFDDIVNSKWFQSTNIVLFLNKSDLFAEKIKSVDMRVCFPDYKGGLEYTAASEFLQHKFKKLNRRTGREIYAHITCATDTENVRVVFNAVKETLITRAMRSGGVGGF